MRRRPRYPPASWIVPLIAALPTAPASAQAYGKPDRGEPGDAMIQAYLAAETEKIHRRFLEGIDGAEAWEARRPRYKREYFHMLGLWPLPPKTPLHATVTGTRKGRGFVVDMLHYQSRPHLYVTANLYRPAGAREGERLPAVLYVCGHSGRGRNGNKTAFQSHGIWFARHGFICLVLDTLQLGEIAAIHHGTYREGRWWWHARGYTPAGVECWNGIRGIDYLVSRPDVDPDRIAVTGISGGGAATFWIAAADERVRVAVPVSGMADLPSYVTNRVINGHCDCMFLYNTFQWPWTRIAALVAPRPLLFVNSDKDAIFPMDANERVINRLERLYSLFGAGDRVDAVVSVGGHAYRKDIRQAAFRFIDTYLKQDPRTVADSEVDLVTRSGRKRIHPIPPEKLRVFPTDADIPADQLNTTIDRHFVPVADVPPPEAGKFAAWKAGLLEELRRVTFGAFPARIPPAKPAGSWDDRGTLDLESEPGIRIALRRGSGVPRDPNRPRPERILLAVAGPGETEGPPSWLDEVREPGDAVYICHPRGIGETRWTRRNPPNYVERSHVLLGRTVDTGRVWDAIAAARYLGAARGGAPVWIAGRGGAGILAAYAALWEEEIAGAIILAPPSGHMDPGAPALLNVLRICDIPEILGMLAPRPLRLRGAPDALRGRVEAIYRAAGAADALRPGRREQADGGPEPVIPKGGVLELFNGKDPSHLYTWLQATGYEDPRGVFSVEDGMLHVLGKPFGYVATRKAYANYRLVVEYRWGERTYGSSTVRNSGILLHAVGPDGNRSPWMASIECQLAQGCAGDLIVIRGKDADGSKIPVTITSDTVRGPDGRTRWKRGGEPTVYSGKQFWWSRHDPAFEERIDTRGRWDVESPLGRWNRVECIARGDRITVRVNGRTVNECYGAFPSAGKIALQSEGFEIWFRRFELHPLAPPRTAAR